MRSKHFLLAQTPEDQIKLRHELLARIELANDVIQAYITKHGRPLEDAHLREMERVVFEAATSGYDLSATERGRLSTDRARLARHVAIWRTTTGDSACVRPGTAGVRYCKQHCSYEVCLDAQGAYWYPITLTAEARMVSH